MKNPRQTTQQTSGTKTDTESQVTRGADIDHDDASRVTSRTGRATQRSDQHQDQEHHAEGYIETNVPGSLSGSAAYGQDKSAEFGAGDDASTRNHSANADYGRSQGTQSSQGAYQANQQAGHQQASNQQGSHQQQGYNQQSAQGQQQSAQARSNRSQQQSERTSDSMQKIGEVWTNWLFGQVQNTTQAFMDLTECRSPSSLASIQRQFVKSNLQNASNAACRITELANQIANSNLDQTENLVAGSSRRANARA